jgi:hypothetical protein
LCLEASMRAAEQTDMAISAVATLVIAGVGLVWSSCATVDSEVDCGRICDKYQACINPDYDISACDSRCEANGAERASTGDLDACESCIDEATCGGQAHDCDDACAGVVP